MNLDAKTIELVALGASVTANCQPCLEYHVKKAREVGAGEDHIREAIEVGRMVRKGAASKMEKLIRTVTTQGDSNLSSGFSGH